MKIIGALKVDDEWICETKKLRTKSTSRHLVCKAECHLLEARLMAIYFNRCVAAQVLIQGIVSPQFMENKIQEVSKNEQNTCVCLTSPTHACIHACTHVCTCTHTYIVSREGGKDFYFQLCMSEQNCND